MRLSGQDIDLIRQTLCNNPVKKAYLFGSFSRGDAHISSDVDIFVEFDYTQRIGLTYIALQQELEQRLNRKVDLLSDQAVSSHLPPFIERDKQLIYSRILHG
ncbi:MAG: nucleotidyltransferase domain-containing protein [Cyclobacteriaceae bacterium]|nr:nucleotidyltransferase domain-containing protein [Cyclobacteriaceae bacterium]